MRKRKWHYILKPAQYEITCDICQGVNLEWSEFEGLVWCYDCLIDTKGTGGIFDGPIPVKLSEALGIVFHRWYMKKKRIQFFDDEKNRFRADAKRQSREYQTQ